MSLGRTIDTTRPTPYRYCLYVLGGGGERAERLFQILVVPVVVRHRDVGTAEANVVALCLGCNGPWVDLCATQTPSRCGPWQTRSSTGESGSGIAAFP